MNSIHQPESYYDNIRSPRGDGQPPQSIHRQSSRHFENFGPPPENIYGMDGMNQRYDAPRYDRMNPLQSPYATFDMGMPQAWNSTSFSHNNNLAGMNATTRGKPGTARGRPGLPPMWQDQGPGMPSNGFGTFGNPPLGVATYRGDHGNPESEEDLIPTAIVIKNIPFAVKKEQLVQVMTELNLPLPYAFNYHFDNGVFRGLAFANFTTAEETAQVINAMNHLELHGRKLRVEYKKMLPQAERDRIEREKRERRGQLEEQHRPMPASQLQTRPSVSSMTSGMRAISPINGVPQGIDMNDKDTLAYYTKLMLFQNDQSQDSLTFPTQTPRQHRTIIHGIAHSLGLGHEAHGEEPLRQVIVFKTSMGGAGLSPSIPQSGFDPNRRGLYRAATTDFSDVREPSVYQQTIQKQQSTNFLGFPEPHNALSASTNLRAAKSFADLRSFTPSPSHPNPGFPAGLAANAAAARYAEMGQSSPGSNRPPALTPGTTATSGSSDALVNGMNSMSINPGFPGRQPSPSRLRSVMSWEREAPGPIGGHRLNGANVDEQNRVRAQNGAQARQGRTSVMERNTGFSRGRPNGHGSRGSDEILPHNGIETVVE